MSARISDHCLLRFLERAGGMDVEGVRRALAVSLQRAFDTGRAVGAAEYSIAAEGLVFVVRNGQVVTCLPDSPAKRMQGAHPRERDEVQG